MRTALVALALAAVACGGDGGPADSSTANAPALASATGPDQLALRVPRKGGTPTVSALPGADSTVWSASERAPGLERVLAFDENAGVIAALSQDSQPVRIDFRLGSVTRERKPSLTHIASADGWAIYGITDKGAVARLTPADNSAWTFAPPVKARDVLPQPNGSLVVVGDSASHTVLWLLQPPETTIAHEAVLPKTDRAIRTQVGDRMYFFTNDQLIGVRTRDLQVVPAVALRKPVRGVVTSPSGDRVYVITDSTRELVVVDRYSEEIAERIELPGVPRELRMDPTGRYVLVRAAGGDSAWVVGVGRDRITGTVHTAWRSDLPAVSPGGRLALVQGKDVVFVDGETLRESSRANAGASDTWFFFSWDGFRPRVAAEGADSAPVAPVPEQEGDNPFAGQLATRDTAPFAPDAGADSAPPMPTVGVPPAPPAPVAAPAQPEFTLQFAAVRDERGARDLASDIRGGRGSARVVATTRVVSTVVGGSTVYRVIAGPFRTREEADVAGQQTGKPYWVYEGAP